MLTDQEKEELVALLVGTGLVLLVMYLLTTI